MRAYVGVTDLHWATFLRGRPDLVEVNFWRPGGPRAFRAIAPGDVFLFKTKSPENLLVGGGIYEGFVALTLASAWEFFGEGNGAATFETFVETVTAITHEGVVDVAVREIGCVLIRDVVFFGVNDLLGTPPDFPRNVVQGKSYDVADAPDEVRLAVQRVLTRADEGRVVGSSLGPTRGEPRLVTPRLGQNGFKAVVQSAYQRRCAITGHKIVPTLEAAHILPVAHGGEHRVDNGLLLRSDVHTLFDRGFLGVDEEYRLRVSPRIRREFGNGDEFYEKEGSRIAVPAAKGEAPSAEFLNWHLTAVFR